MVLGVRFLEIFEVQAGPSVTRTRAAAQYVTTVSDSAAVSTFGERYVFAPLEQTTVAVETRLNVTFTPNLTFELYAQPFVSGGEYRDLMELQSPITFDFPVYGRDVGSVRRESDGRHTVHPDGTGSRGFQIDPLDFNFRTLLGNAVLRWEWRPGSTLFLAWRQTRSEELFDTAPPEAAGQVGSFRLGPDTRVLFGLRPDNSRDRIGPVLGSRHNVVQHMRALPYCDVAAAIWTVRTSPAPPAVRLALEFLVLTAARRGEVRWAGWTEIDRDEGVCAVPARRTKANREHRVPLGGRAMEVLEEVRSLGGGSPLVFTPGDGPLGTVPISEKRLRRVLGNLRIGPLPDSFRSSFRD